MHLQALINELQDMYKEFGPDVSVVMMVDNLSADINQICHEVDPGGNVYIILDDYLKSVNEVRDVS